jgi:hypothetical protein
MLGSERKDMRPLDDSSIPRLLSANATQDECEQRDHRSGCCRSSGGSFIRMQSDNDAQPFKETYIESLTAYVIGGLLSGAGLFFAWWFTGRC